MNSKVHIIPLNIPLKKIATLSVRERLNEVVDETLLYTLMGAAVESRNTDYDIIESLKQIDLTRVIKDSKGLNKPFKCSFYAKRTAWIYKDDKNHFRYYSRKNKGIYSFDIVDLLSIFRNETKKEVFSFIQNKWNIKGLNPWHIEQIEKYDSNKWLLDKIQLDSVHYPNLNKLIKEEHWDVLKRMNDFAKEKLTGKDLAVNGEAVFFLSNNHLKETYFSNISNSTVNNLVNLFCVLGFIKKIPFEALPKALSVKAEINHKKKQVLNYTSYYQVAKFHKVYKDAEKRAVILIKNKIYYHRLSKNTVKNLFGESFANEIYVQHTFGNKGRAEPIYVRGQDTFYTESERLENKFLEAIEKTGKCSKRKLADYSLLPRSKFSIVWSNLIQKYQCEEIYPTKQEMKKYKMDKRLLIATPIEKNLKTNTIDYM